MSLRIRPMRDADLSAVMAIEQVSFSTPWTWRTFRNLLRRTDAHLYVAELGPEGDRVLVGYAVFWRVADQAELGDLAVDPTRRREGIGARLLEHVIARAGALGIRELFLEVRESNTAAQELYRRYGFAHVGRRRGYYSNPREDALVLLRKAKARELVGVAEANEDTQTG